MARTDRRTTDRSSSRSRTPAKPEEPTRRRRDAASAREAILDAAERRLVAAGPSGIRLQEVAAELGVSHPTLLHHFGSREALVKAVCQRAVEAINASLVAALSRSTGEETQIAAMIEAVSDAFTRGGHARVMMWLALEGHRVDGAEVRLADVVDAAHRLRKAQHKGKGRTPPREDTAHTVALAALALMGAAVLFPAMLENAGLSGDPAALASRFRSWLARVVAGHLESND